MKNVTYQQKMELLQRYKQRPQGINDAEVLREIEIDVVKQSLGVKSADQVNSGLYTLCIDAYDQFLKESVGVGVKMNAAQGKSMKDIIKYLKKESRDKSDEGILKSWRFILRHWSRTGDFIGKQKTLTQINKNLIEIIDKIRNGSDKKQASKNQLDQLELSLEQKLRDRANKGAKGA